MTRPSKDISLKLIFVGDMGVGKSSILLRYTDNDFPTTDISTIGVDFKIKTVVLGDFRVKLQIWDTAGQDRFQSIPSTYYRRAHGVLVVYDVNDVESFHNAEKWLDEVDTHADESIARILVGNKNEDPELKTVATQDAQRLAARNGSLFIETSAKNGDNIDEIEDLMGSITLTSHFAKRCAGESVIERIGLIDVLADTTAVVASPFIGCKVQHHSNLAQS